MTEVLSQGAASASKLAEMVFPIRPPPVVDVTDPVDVANVPTGYAWMDTRTVQYDPAARLPPEKETLLPLAMAFTVPPQVDEVFGES